MRKAMAGKKLLFISILVIAAMAALSPAHAAAPPPMVSILNPAHGTSGAPSVISNSPAAGGSFKVQIQVWNDVADITAVAIGYLPSATDPLVDANWTTWVAATSNGNYSCGTGCGVYDATLTLTPGNDYWLRARATSTADGTGYSSDERIGINARYTYIKLVGPKVGTGTLLARDKASVMCIDCHGQMPSHSSQSTDTGYQNWQIGCRDCHTPHSTTNIYLIKEQIITPRSGTKTVDFRKATTVYNGTGGYVDGGAGAATEGVCQVCHTLGPRWTNAGPGDGHFYDSDCASCHLHNAGFKGEGDCSACHAGASDVDNFQADGDTAAISTAEWAAQGHGRPAASGNYPSGNPPADFDGLAGTESPCLWCHDGNAPHSITSANPFRLKGKDLPDAGNGWNGACLVCHDTDATANYTAGEAGFTAINRANVVKVDKWHYMGAHSALRNGGKFCWDCHDPHGDTASQIQMVQKRPAKTSDGTYGIPSTTPSTDVVFTDDAVGAGAGGFALTSGTFEEGICNTCHTDSAASPKMKYYTSTSSLGTHYTSVCTGCHAHSGDTANDGNAFVGAGDCDTCHGYPPMSGDGKAAINGAGGKGAHWSVAINGAHIDNSALDAENDTYDTGLAQCIACHPMADASHPDNDDAANIGFNGITNSFDGTAVIWGGVSGEDPSSTPKTCTNVNCHFGAPSPRWSCPGDE